MTIPLCPTCNERMLIYNAHTKTHECHKCNPPWEKTGIMKETMSDKPTIKYLTYRFTLKEWNFVMCLATLNMPFPAAASFVKNLRRRKNLALFILEYRHFVE